jgi:hypothetical protein
MPRPAGRFLLLALAVLVTSVTVGCELVDPELETYRRSLSLEVIGWKRVASGIALELRVSNKGTRSIDACVGPGRFVTVKSKAGSGSQAEMVHHPGCVKNFRLAPAGEFVWGEVVEMTSEAFSAALEEIEVTVQILNPRRCNGWTGCSGTDLRAAYKAP